MALLQINVDNTLKKAIQKKAKQYGVPASSLVRIILVQSFVNTPDPVASSETWPELAGGNVFNAHRDNQGKGISIDDFLKLF